jgi:ribonuclease G
MREIAFDASPGEIRAVLFEDGAAVELHIFREGHAARGAVLAAKIVSKQTNRAFVRLSNGEDAILMQSPDVPEGASASVRVVREVYSEPGDTKRAVATLTDAPLTEEDDVAARWRHDLAARADADVAPDVRFDGHFDIASAGRSDVDGATIWFERTKAGLVFDIDGNGDARTLNLAAAAEIARLLRLFQIGGAAIIDFIGMENRQARTEVAEAFDRAAASDPRGFERTAINGFGLMQVIRAKSRASILDTLFGTRRVTLSDETMMLQLLRDASRAPGVGVRRCVTNPALAAQLAQPRWQALIEKASRAAGAAIEIVVDQATRGYGHVHVSQA